AAGAAARGSRGSGQRRDRRSRQPGREGERLVGRAAGLGDARQVDRLLFDDHDAVVEGDRVGAEGKVVQLRARRQVVPGVQPVHKRLAELDERARAAQAAFPAGQVGGVHVLAEVDAVRLHMTVELAEGDDLLLHEVAAVVDQDVDVRKAPAYIRQEGG